MFGLSSAALLSLVSSALAHGYISEIYVADKHYDGSNYSSPKDGSPLRGVPSDLGYVK